MEIQQDYKELFGYFNANHVEYLIVGGHAVAFHGSPRFTGDIDLLTSISGVTWENAFKGAVKDHYGDVPVLYLGRDALILNKKATGRKRDEADLEALGA
jgi:hypothetical protein